MLALHVVEIGGAVRPQRIAIGQQVVEAAVARDPRREFAQHTLAQRTFAVVDAVVVREGKNLKGRLLGLVLGTVGKGKLRKAFENTIKAVEARNATAARASV